MCLSVQYGRCCQRVQYVRAVQSADKCHTVTGENGRSILCADTGTTALWHRHVYQASSIPEAGTYVERPLLLSNPACVQSRLDGSGAADWEATPSRCS